MSEARIRGTRERQGYLNLDACFSPHLLANSELFSICVLNEETFPQNVHVAWRQHQHEKHISA